MVNKDIYLLTKLQINRKIALIHNSCTKACVMLQHRSIINIKRKRRIVTFLVLRKLMLKTRQ